MTRDRHPDMDPGLVQSCLGRVLASQAFAASPKMSRFLRFVVGAKLTGQASRVKAYSIGVEVFDRSPGFDPGADSIVRVNAIRLRGLLDAYYAGEGREDPVRFLLAKGSYVPEFAEARAPGPAVGTGPARILLTVERLVLLGGPPDQDYLTAGLTEELVASLSRFGDNLIVVRSPAAPEDDFGLGAVPQAQGIAYCLSAIAYRLRGSLRRDSDQIRVGFTLVETASDSVVWSETFAHALSSASLFEIQEQVARKTAARVLDPHGVVYRSLKRQPAALLGTYLALFRYHEYEERFTPETHLRAREELERAVREEPGYADAWAVLANVTLGEALFGFNRTLPRPALIEKCLDLAHRAVALDPRGVMAHYILAMILFYRKDRSRFMAAADQALALAPHSPDNLAVIGMHLALAGQWDRGLSLVQEAMDLNPFHPPWYHLVFSLHHLRLGRHREALGVIGRFARLDFFPFQVNLAVIHGHLGHEAEARDALNHMFALWPEAGEEMHEILAFWFPYEGLAAIFADGLTKVGLPVVERPGETQAGLDSAARTQQTDAACGGTPNPV